MYQAVQIEVKHAVAESWCTLHLLYYCMLLLLLNAECSQPYPTAPQPSAPAFQLHEARPSIYQLTWPLVPSRITAMSRLEHKVYASDDGRGWQLHAEMQPLQDHPQGGPRYGTRNSQPVLTTPQLVATSSTEVGNQVSSVHSTST